MALSMLIAIIAAPGLLGSQEAIRQSQSQEKREEHRARRCNLIATCTKSSRRSREINGRPIVLRNGKLWIDTGTGDGEPLGHMYAGYYLPYPDTKYEGLVTTITDVAPVMNWVYIDRETHEVKYGVRLDAQPNFTGPFDCTRQDRRLTFDGWEGFCAVERAPGLWELYFDVDDDGLKGKVEPGMRVLEIELSRKEKRFQKEKEARQQDQTTKRKVDPTEEAPVDEPLGMEALVEKPGVVGDKVDIDEEAQRPEVQLEEGKPKPFRIPRSIFDNPPPVLQGSSFERPESPPPAYEQNESSINAGAAAVSATLVSPIQPSTQAAPDLPPPRIETPEDNAPPNEAISQLEPKTAFFTKAPRTRSASPSTVQPQSADEQRSAQKVSPGSRTRALAQAQMFEAMAAAQKPKSAIRQSSTTRGSRASSASKYSRDSQDVSKKVEEDDRGVISPTPPPLALRTSKKEEAASKFPTSQPKPTPRQRALTDPSDPAVFDATVRTASSRREPIGRPSPSAVKPSTSRSTSQASPRPPLQRRGTSQDLQRPALQRRGTTTAQPAGSSSSRAVPHVNRRGSLALTMTSGRGNRGMTTRVGGTVERGRRGTLQSAERNPMGRKTTSALFREIDELVGTEGSGSKEEV